MCHHLSEDLIADFETIGSESVTISGAASALDALDGRLKAKGVFARKLKVSKAYHNPTYMGQYSFIFKDSLKASGIFTPTKDQKKKKKIYQ